MKKNRMMRLASLLLVMVLMTTSVISGTFAKYTTQDSASDSARVAKWGVELQVVGNLFGDTYKDTIVKENDDTLTVQSVDKNADVVAPGTKNEKGFTFSLKGQPEVDGEVTTEMTVQNVFLKAGTYGVMIPVDTGVVTAENFDEFEENLYCFFTDKYTKPDSYMNGYTYYTLEDTVVVPNDYYPVVYNLAGTTNYSNASYGVDSLKTIADLIAAELGISIDDTVNTDTSAVTYKGTKEFGANTNLETWKLNGLTLTWDWAFDRDSAQRKGDDAYYTNVADTLLGLLNNGTVDNTIEGEVVKLNRQGTYYIDVVEYADYCVDTQFSIDITVTQVD